jgi:predicted house-cleaning noncanonical NTP pyrophosphatase (MazG superfamily)/8-oxo-dGTP pyrophosphatase MutT (NUDIX family)
MDMQNDDTFYLGIKALILNSKSEILLIHKPAPSDYWDLPGGRIQPGETIDEALSREVREEIGNVSIRNKVFFSADITTIRIKEKEGEKGLILFTYHCSVEIKGEIKISEEHDSFQWCSIEDAAQRLEKKFTDSLTQKIRELQFSKLVRDRIPEIITANNQTPITHIATLQEYQERLEKKLSEEVNEFVAEDSNKREELADILEVIDAITLNSGFDKKELELLREEKVKKNGAFHKRIVLDAVHE